MEKKDEEYNRWEYKGDWGGFWMFLKSMVPYSAGEGVPLKSMCEIIPVAVWSMDDQGKSVGHLKIYSPLLGDYSLILSWQGYIYVNMSAVTWLWLWSG